MATQRPKQVKLLKANVAKFSNDLIQLMRDNGLDGLQLHQIKFKAVNSIHQCPICKETGQPGTLVCDPFTGECHCECP